jgi:serine/threonine-protein kinase RsbW
VPPEFLPPGTAARPEVLESVHDLLERAWSAHPDVSAADRMSVETALVEVAANIVEHAGGAELGLEVEVHPDRVQAVFRDSGAAFGGDLDAAGLPDDELSERGRGLALARTLLDQVAYERAGGINQWSLVRRRTGP